MIRSKHTIHEFRQIHLIPSLIGITIGQNAIIDELPPKRIRNDDDDPLDGRFYGRRFRHICIQAMQGGDCSSGRSVLVHVAAEAVGTGHVDKYISI